MIITEQKDLEKLCAGLKKGGFVTVDTEFLRDKTYYPVLCLIQMAGPQTEAAAIDPMADGIDLSPVFDVLTDKKVIKVFHAARQDLEIFYNLTDTIPEPLFDTQVAAMVCGYGDQIGYHNLVQGICGKQLDKGAQFTDWSRRPLTKKQTSYALDDVVYLRDVYLHLSAQLEEQGRTGWVKEEMAVLNDPATYKNVPEESWQRIKVRSDKPKVLSVLREVAAWREKEAQRRDIPRTRILRDETLVDMAVHAPKDEKALSKIRGISADMARSKWGKPLLAAVKRGLDEPKEKSPVVVRKKRFPGDMVPILEMLKMLLKIQCAEHNVATKLVANKDDLETLALKGSKADIGALKGWRHEVFGQEALALIEGKIGLSLKNGKIFKGNI